MTVRLKPPPASLSAAPAVQATLDVRTTLLSADTEFWTRTTPTAVSRVMHALGHVEHAARLIGDIAETTGIPAITRDMRAAGARTSLELADRSLAAPAPGRPYTNGTLPAVTAPLPYVEDSAAQLLLQSARLRIALASTTMETVEALGSTDLARSARLDATRASRLLQAWLHDRAGYVVPAPDPATGPTMQMRTLLVHAAGLLRTNPSSIELDLARRAQALRQLDRVAELLRNRPVTGLPPDLDVIVSDARLLLRQSIVTAEMGPLDERPVDPILRALSMIDANIAWVHGSAPTAR